MQEIDFIGTSEIKKFKLLYYMCNRERQTIATSNPIIDIVVNKYFQINFSSIFTKMNINLFTNKE